MTKPPYPLIPEPMQKSWLERNPLWKIPAGFLVLLLFTAGILILVECAFHHSEVSIQAAARARENPQVRQLLGEPIVVGITILGNIHINGNVGHADLTIPISGPNGKGVIRAVANKCAGEWCFALLRVDINGRSEAIDLQLVQPPSLREF
jgi:Cytochrome oxidase complex assembly protein 1